MFYGPDVWDPWLIISRMFFMQAAFYLVAGVWLLLFSFVLGADISLQLLLSPRTMSLGYGSFAAAPVLSYILIFPPWYAFVAAIAPFTSLSRRSLWKESLADWLAFAHAPPTSPVRSFSLSSSSVPRSAWTLAQPCTFGT